jgi:hypothetical protein
LFRVGKTEIALALAQVLFGSKYKNKFTLLRSPTELRAEVQLGKVACKTEELDFF